MTTCRPPCLLMIGTQDEIRAKWAYREIRLLLHIQHENVVGITNLFYSRNPSADGKGGVEVPVSCFFLCSGAPVDIYIVTEFVGADLHQVVVQQPLSDQHVRFLIYQLLRALKVRDNHHLMPTNITYSMYTPQRLCTAT